MVEVDFNNYLTTDPYIAFGEEYAEQGLSVLSETPVQFEQAELYFKKGAEFFADMSCTFYLGLLQYLMINTANKSVRSRSDAVYLMKKATMFSGISDGAPDFYLGVVYFIEGERSPINLDYKSKAIDCFKKAGTINLSWLTMLGKGFETGNIPLVDFSSPEAFYSLKFKKDYEKAIEWYQYSVKRGFSKGIYERIARIYQEDGYGIERDYWKALFYIDKISNTKLREILSAPIYAKGGYGVHKDIQHALRSCSRCKDELAVLAGEIYQYDFYPPDYKNAREWYRIGTKSKDAKVRSKANAKLGWIYLKGLGVSQRLDIAYSCFKSSSSSCRSFYKSYFAQNRLKNDGPIDGKCFPEYTALNDPENEYYALANNYTGLNYLHQLDYKEAIKYFEIAAEYNCPQAFNSLGDVYQYGHRVEIDYKKAFEYYLKAATEGQDDNDGQYKLGLMYLEGKGTDIDYELALYWLEKAQTLGNEIVQQPLINLIKKIVDLAEE